MSRHSRIVFVALLACALTLHPQTSDLLSDFLHRITASTEDFSLADKAVLRELDQIEEQLPNIPRDQVAASVPPAIAILTRGTPQQRTGAIMLLFEIARDQRDLLQPYLPQILPSLRDPTPGLNGFTEYILLNLYPQPIDTVVPYLSTYIDDEQMDENFRAEAIGTLVWYAPNDPNVISAIGGFLKAKHGKEARAEALKGIGLMMQAGIGRYSPELVAFVVDAVKNDPETRDESIPALGRCGWNAFQIASPILTEIMIDDRESERTRADARAAIDDILHSPHR